MAITGNSFGATDRSATEKTTTEKPALDKPSGVLVGVSPVNVPAAKDAAEHFGLLHVLVVTPVIFFWLRERELRRSQRTAEAIEREETRTENTDE